MSRVADMTLGQAVALLDGPQVPCGCHGGEWCCIRAYAQALALRRAAHVVAKLLVDATRHRPT